MRNKPVPPRNARAPATQGRTVVDTRRRNFIKRDLFAFIVESLRPFTKEIWPDRKQDPEKRSAYFSSYKSCYAILAETSLEELQADARKLGLDPVGKDKYQLAREIYGRDCGNGEMREKHGR